MVAADPSFGNAPYPGLSAEWIAVVEAAPENFRTRVNKILEDHIVKFYLQQNSELAPVDSQEMHNEVVAPTLHLLHSQPQFADAEAASRKRSPNCAYATPGMRLLTPVSPWRRC